jgi:2,3-bisphosphoglycerate-dependent phosphoglycerate mutase
MRQKTVLFIRHGETDWNAEVRWQGSTDVPLNENGIRQAWEVSEVLRHRELEAVLSSDLARARQTAEIIAEPHDIPVYATDGLREVHLGAAEGLRRGEVIERFGVEAFDRWKFLVDPDFSFPGGESQRDAVRRGLPALEGFLRGAEGREVAVVFHGMIMRLVLRRILPEASDMIHVPNGKVFELSWDGDAGMWGARGDLLQLLREPTRGGALR